MTQQFPDLEFDQEKLRNLVLYVAERELGDEDFGKTKLAKILWLSDFTHYAEHGRAITGATYVHLPHGPGPDDFDDLLTDMEERGLLKLRRRSRYGYPQVQPIPIGEADVGAFKGSEIAVVEEILRRVSGMTAKELSELSHDFYGWAATANGDRIPYGASFIADVSEQPTEEELSAIGW